MNPTETADQTQRCAQIHFAGTTLAEHRHICAFFSSPDEEYRVLLPFIKEGFERGDKAYHVVNSGLREEHLQRLESAGIDLPEPKKGGQFELYDWEDVYFRDGRFDQNKMLGLLEETLADSPKQAFPLIRLISHGLGAGRLPGNERSARIRNEVQLPHALEIEMLWSACTI